MADFDGGTTDRMLIGRVADWRDASAWRRFDATYRPMVRRWGRQFGFAGDDLEELCQVVLVGVLGRAKGFCYDPSRSFRGWLRRITHCRAVEQIRARRRSPAALAAPEAQVAPHWHPRPEATPPPRDDRLDGLVEEVQRAVRARVAPENWRIFWLIRVDGRPVAEVAAAVGKTYAATFRNQERIARMLRDEAERRLPRHPAPSA